MEFTTVVSERRSVRNFSDRAIPEETLAELFRVAGMSPSWENAQPWSVYVAVGETLSKIKYAHLDNYLAKAKDRPDLERAHRVNFSQRAQRTVSAFLKDIEEKTGDVKRGNLLKQNLLLFNAPALAFLTLPKGYSAYSVFDLGAFAMTLMLAAKDKGIASVPAYEIVKFSDEIRKYAPIPDDEDVVMGVALGYPAADPLNEYRSPRMAVEEYLTISR